MKDGKELYCIMITNSNQQTYYSQGHIFLPFNISLLQEQQDLKSEMRFQMTRAFHSGSDGCLKKSRLVASGKCPREAVAHESKQRFT